MDIANKLATWRQELPKEVTLVAVSKEQPIEYIEAAYAAGQRHFGESRVQALQNRYEALPKDIHWHMIGHLQRNKVKCIAPFIHLIHSVDSTRLLEQIEVEGKQQNRLLNCLLQLHIATQDEHKPGFPAGTLTTYLNNECMKTLPHVRICGLMGMASNSTNQKLIRNEFTLLKQEFERIKQNTHHPRICMQTLSMGMSNDYKEALATGSNMLRLGTAIFGKRNKTQD